MQLSTFGPAIEALTNSERRRTILRLSSYGLLVLLSYGLITFVVRTPTFTGYDAGGYLGLAENMRQAGSISFYDELRTYGYPLFLAAVETVAALFGPALNPLDFIIFVQFVLHTGASILSVLILDRLIGREKVSFRINIACFALVQLNAVLLGLTRDILTDSISVFLLTFLLWILITPIRYKPVWMGLILSTLAVVRPFFQDWALLFLILLIALLLLKWLIAMGPRSALRQARHDMRRIVTRSTVSLVQFALPVILIVGLQYFFVYRVEHHFSIVGQMGSQIAAEIATPSDYFFKYETYIGDQKRDPIIGYIFSERQTQVAAATSATGDFNFIGFDLQHISDSLYLFTVKAVGMFQHYEWSTYRRTLTNPISYIFFWGLIPFAALMIANWQLIFNWRTIFTARKEFQWLLIVIAVDTNLIAYTLLSLAEYRYMAPFLPAATLGGLYAVLVHRRRQNLIIIVTCSALLYFMVYEILRAAQQ